MNKYRMSLDGGEVVMNDVCCEPEALCGSINEEDKAKVLSMEPGQTIMVAGGQIEITRLE